MRLLYALIFVLFSAPLYAQSVSLLVTWEHDGNITTGYRVYIDNVKKADVSKSACVSIDNKLQCKAVVDSTNAAHQFIVSAYNADAEVKSQPISWNGELTPPNNLGIKIQVITEINIK